MDNNLLGEFELNNISLAPCGVPRIEVTLDIDRNGIITVSAVDKSSGRQNKITIVNSNDKLSSLKIEQLIEEAKKYHEESKQQVIAAKDDLVKNTVTLKTMAVEVEEYCRNIAVNCSDMIDWLNDNPTPALKDIEDR